MVRLAETESVGKEILIVYYNSNKASGLIKEAHFFTVKCLNNGFQ
jgi:hypothetical protein